MFVLSAPVICTSHLTKETAELLSRENKAYGPTIVAAYDCGFFIYAGDTDTDHEMPTDLHDVLQFARRGGFDWVRLDADAEKADGLTTYDW